MLEVHISRHSLFRLKITVGCLVCACGVRGVCCVVVLWWCVCVVCGEAWHTLSLLFSLLPLLFPFLFLSSFSFSFSLAPPLTLALALVLSLMFPPLLLPPLLSSLLPPSHTQKKEEGTLLQEYFRRGIYFYYSFILFQKNQSRVKLQSLQFNFNSKTIGL